MGAAEGLAPAVGTAAACRALGLCRASLYRRRHPRSGCGLRPMPARALSSMERETVLATLHAERFVDQSPAEVYATLLDEGTYLCSIRTMYRLLAGAGEVRERRNQLRHPRYVAPVLEATGPHQVWSWDITKLLGPVKWTSWRSYLEADLDLAEGHFDAIPFPLARGHYLLPSTLLRSPWLRLVQIFQEEG